MTLTVPRSISCFSGWHCSYRVHSWVKPLLPFLPQQLAGHFLVLCKLSSREEASIPVPAWFLHFMYPRGVVSSATGSYYLVLGATERNGNSLYCFRSLVFLPDQQFMRLCPTPTTGIVQAAFPSHAGCLSLFFFF